MQSSVNTASAIQLPADAPARISPTVLVVDDDDTLRTMTQEALAISGFRVAEARNGKEAFSSFDKELPDLVLLDVIMPEMDGFATCAAIRKMAQGVHVPIVMMTGLDDLESVTKAYDVGATDFVVKPLNYPILVQRLRYTLRATQTAAALRESKARLLTAQRTAKLGYWEWQTESERLRCSEEMLRLLGEASSKLAGSLEAFIKYIHPEDRDYVSRTLERVMRDGIGYPIEYRVVRHDGTVRTVHQETEVICECGSTKLIGTVQDITERLKIEKQIRYLAYYDAVTGLPNRAHLKDHLTRILSRAERFNETVAIFFLDLDNFKLVNDTLGHSCGDSLLAEVAKRLLSCVRDYDHVVRSDSHSLDHDGNIANVESVARLGGDEFVIVADGISDADSIANLANRIGKALSPSIIVDGHELYVTASIGISVFPSDGDNLEILLKHADVAMYYAKDSGKSCYRFYSEATNVRLITRFALETQLHKALESQEFLLHYQPKIDLTTGSISGLEALLRWHHPEKGLILPAEFIPLAEETGLIVPLGEWVLHKACAQVKSLHDAGMRPLRVAVNVSAAQFSQKPLKDQILSALDETALDPEYLELEITETMLMENTEFSAGLLSEMKAIGVSVSIDDFGTGYSSLAYLKRFPLDAIKIDRSLIRDVNNDPDDAAIVSAIIALAHKLRLRVIAEGVEDEAQLEFLKAQGCEEAQGYLFSAALTADAAEAWISNWEQDRGHEETFGRNARVF